MTGSSLVLLLLYVISALGPQLCYSQALDTCVFSAGPPQQTPARQPPPQPETSNSYASGSADEYSESDDEGSEGYKRGVYELSCE